MTDQSVQECFLCQREVLEWVVRESLRWRVIVNHNQNLLGKLCIVLRRHEESVARLTEDEWADLHGELRWAVDRLTRAFAPDHLNYCFLQNQDVHVHLHVLPRYAAGRHFAGVEFDDPDYGEHYGLDREQLVNLDFARHLRLALTTAVVSVDDVGMAASDDEVAMTHSDVMAVSVRPADASEFGRLREIAVDGKSYWGYEPDLVKQWVALGDFSPEVFAAKKVYVAEVGGEVVGWSSLIAKGAMCWLDDMWVAPVWIRRGIGARLFAHAVGEARALGVRRMEWEAEPFAVGFYEKMGARYLRDSGPSAISGRTLPIMGVDIRT